ncbi:MAG: hypothetical protein ACJ8GN_13375 [Longimicrobiaceae bacterium]
METRRLQDDILCIVDSERRYRRDTEAGREHVIIPRWRIISVAGGMEDDGRAASALICSRQKVRRDLYLPATLMRIPTFIQEERMRRTGIYLLVAASLAAAHAVNPGVARAEDGLNLWGISELGETCGGKCIRGMLCCKAVVAPPA